MKGCDIVVGGSVGHVSAFMAQAGRLVVCGDAGAGLGDSLYEAVDLRPRQDSQPGRRRPRRADDRRRHRGALPICSTAAGFNYAPSEFKRSRLRPAGLYHWNADANQEY